MTWNKMIHVFCPLSGRVEWANGTKVNPTANITVGRCTKCGASHSKA